MRTSPRFVSKETEMAKKQAEEAAENIPTNLRRTSDREVAAAYFKLHKLVPQAVGFDGYDSDKQGVLATVESQAYLNVESITQTVYSERDPQNPIHLLPGDFVLGDEFKRFTALYGGPLREKNAKEIATLPVSSKSKRDAAYFEARGKMKGPIAERAANVKLDRPANLE